MSPRSSRSIFATWSSSFPRRRRSSQRRCIAARLSVSGREGGHISYPTDVNVKNYLLRIGALQLAVGELPEPFTRREAVGFRECERFQDQDHAATVARQLTDVLTERCSLDATARAAVYTCLGELCQNVPDHAMTEFGGIAVAQGFPGRHRFEVAIVDLGVGIRQSLIAHPAYAKIADDTSAIEKALELGTTSKPGSEGKTRHSGYGLTVTQHLLQLNGGRLVVRSGRGEVWVGADPLVEQRRIDFPGTLILLEADTRAPLDVTRVYDDLLGELDD